MNTIDNHFYFHLLVTIVLCAPMCTWQLTGRPAGIIPYAQHQGTIWLLFDQEAGWIRSYLWQDFGGSSDATDPDIKYTAARECTEETRHVFGSVMDAFRRAHIDVTRLNPSGEHANIPLTDPRVRKIIEQSHAKSVQYLLNHLPPGNDPYVDIGSYRMYFAHVDYIDANEFRNGPKVPHWDKVDYAWVPIHDLLATMDKAIENENKPPYKKAEENLFVPKRYTSGINPRLRIFKYMARGLLSSKGRTILADIARLAPQPTPKPPIKPIELTLARLKHDLTELNMRLP